MDRTFIISYLALRKIVGLLGIAFPLLLIVGSITLSNCEWPDIQSSISGYYHTVMRDVFVGTLCIVAFFLFAYRGYTKWDAIAGRAACFFALGVAFFPTSLDEPYTICTIAPLPLPAWVSKAHYICAALLFVVFTIFSLFLFTKTHAHISPTPRKRIRNEIYRLCGILMAACIVLLGVYFLFPGPAWLQQLKPVFWLEGTALVAFGISWLTKGEFIFPDKRTKEDSVARETAPIRESVKAVS